MCSSAVNRQMRSRCHSASGNIMSLSSLNLGNVPCLSSWRDNSAGEALRHKSSCPKYPRSVRVS